MSLPRNEKITEAIKQGIINPAASKTQWGGGKNNHSNTKKEAARPLFKKLLIKAPSSLDILHFGNHENKEKDKDKDKDKDAEKAKQQRRVITKSKSIGNLHLDVEESKNKEREKESVSGESGNNGKERKSFHSRGRSNSDLRPMLNGATPPPNSTLLQAIANLIDLSGPGIIFFALLFICGFL